MNTAQSRIINSKTMGNKEQDHNFRSSPRADSFVDIISNDAMDVARMETDVSNDDNEDDAEIGRAHV